ncbi:50S ribosomal protein L32 [Streptomyces sp. NPDC000348]
MPSPSGGGRSRSRRSRSRRRGRRSHKRLEARGLLVEFTCGS